MATENKEKEKGEAIFPLTQEQINQIAAIGAKEGVRAYKEEQKKEERRRKKEDSKVRKTKKLLSSYRRIKATLSDGEQFTPEEQAELRWKFIEDLMGNTREIAGKSERTIKDTERKREEDLYCVFRIEKATEMYREECEKSGSEEAKRRYRELSMMYLDEKPYTVQEMTPERKNKTPMRMVSQVAVSSRYLMSSVPTMMAMMARKKELCNTFISMMIFCKSNLSDRKENWLRNLS